MRNLPFYMEKFYSLEDILLFDPMQVVDTGRKANTGLKERRVVAELTLLKMHNK